MGAYAAPSPRRVVERRRKGAIVMLADLTTLEPRERPELARLGGPRSEGVWGTRGMP